MANLDDFWVEAGLPSRRIPPASAPIKVTDIADILHNKPSGSKVVPCNLPGDEQPVEIGVYSVNRIKQAGTLSRNRNCQLKKRYGNKNANQPEYSGFHIFSVNDNGCSKEIGKCLFVLKRWECACYPKPLANAPLYIMPSKTKVIPRLAAFFNSENLSVPFSILEVIA